MPNWNDSGDNGINWEAIINRGIDVVGGVFSHGNYISPDDPRFRQRYPNYDGVPGLPVGGQIGGQVTGNLGPGSAGFGLNFTPTTWMLILLGVVILLRKK